MDVCSGRLQPVDQAAAGGSGCSSIVPRFLRGGLHGRRKAEKEEGPPSTLQEHIACCCQPWGSARGATRTSGTPLLEDSPTRWWAHPKPQGLSTCLPQLCKQPFFFVVVQIFFFKNKFISFSFPYASSEIQRPRSSNKRN